MASNDKPLFEVSVGLDMQGLYDQARALSFAWATMADDLEFSSGASICEHPESMRIEIDEEGTPPVCKGCNRPVPAWALERDAMGLS